MAEGVPESAGERFSSERLLVARIARCLGESEMAWGVLCSHFAEVQDPGVAL